MKSFKTLMSEVAQPSERGAGDEQAFKDQHSYKVKPHPVALPHQHTGEIQKPKASRRADQEGSANYDTAYAYGMNALMSKAMGEETDLVENPAEEIPMMKSQLDFICTAATAISEALGNNDPEEWYQNKLATAHEAMKTLHANIVGKNENTAASNAKALDNATASTAAGKKAVTLKKAPWDKTEELSGGQKKLDHNKNGKIDGHDFAVMRARKKNESVETLDEDKSDRTDDRGQDVIVGEGIVNELSKKTLGSYIKKSAVDASWNRDSADKRVDGIRKATNKLVGETTMSALKKPVTVTTVDGKTRTVMKTTRDNRTDERGQDKIKTNESVEQFDEAYRAGIVKFKDGKQTIIKKQDADLLNKMLKDLSPASRKSMTKVAETDQAGYDEILGFAREAL